MDLGRKLLTALRLYRGWKGVSSAYGAACDAQDAYETLQDSLEQAKEVREAFHPSPLEEFLASQMEDE